MEVTVSKDELYDLIKQAVKEVLQEESIEYFLKSIPLVSKEEMEDIENLYDKPPSEKEVAYSESIEI